MSKNLLKYEISPYLLQHKDNPVHWLPWGEKALKQANISKKPILLSIGYAACHWCHVMAHESFEDPETAEVMNRLFINIKVDREERPDIDKIYMNSIHLMGEQGGWPLTMFLSPNGEPYWGGTYFPKIPQYGRPGFIQVLTQMAEIYQTQPEKIKATSESIKHHLNKKVENDTPLVLTENIADQIANRLLQQIDFNHGGLKGAPKFPQTIILELLWRAGIKFALPEYHDAVIISLTQMSQGGIYDHLGGGYSRYSVDARWLAPHFEKMLYDNALILDLLIRTYQVTTNPLFQHHIEETIAWLDREMITKEGAFCSSLDADSEGVEGKFYVWTAQEIQELLKTDYELFAKYYDVTEEGNWEQVNILNRLKSTQTDTNEIEHALTKNREALLAQRQNRIRPGLDDKVLSDWNGLMITTLANAASAFNNLQWLTMAKKAFKFITSNMIIEGKLCHAARAGKIHHPATADGYANMIRASLALYQATNNPTYLDRAIDLNTKIYAHYWDRTEGGYFFTADYAESLIVRTRSAADDATPNANGIMAQNLIKLFLVTGNRQHLARADQIFSAFTPELLQNIFNSASMMVAFDMRLELLSVVVAAGKDNFLALKTITIIRTHTPASAALMIVKPDEDLNKAHPAYGKSTLKGRTTVYICRNTTCSHPLTGEKEIIQALKAL